MLLKQLRCQAQDFAGYISVHQAAFVACIVRFTCNIRSYYAGECDINCELEKRVYYILEIVVRINRFLNQHNM